MSSHHHKTAKRETFTSGLGFIMACVGSAVGMGNIWRFPTLVSAWGGMTFLIPYFLFVILIGSSGVIGEMALGRAGHGGPVKSFGVCTEKRWGNPSIGQAVGMIPVLGSLALATLDQTLGQRQSQAGLILKKSLAAINDEFDCAIVDCPPVLGVMMVNALAASSSIIVPTQTEFLALKGLERMMKTFEILRGTKARPLRYLIVPTMFDRRTRASNQTLESIKEAYGDVVWRDVIPIDTRFRDCSELHVPAPIKFPYSKGCLAYEKLLNDLLKVEGQTK